MAGFFKILLRNVLEGPSTDPFPLGETFTPKRFRGKVVLNPDLCVGCGICRHTCAAGAINIHVRPDQTGYDFTVWHNSCCLCASCRHYCPTGAITLSNDWHNAHTQEEKFTWLEQKFVPYIPCAGCGTPMRPIPLSIAKKIYLNNTDVDWEQIIKLCPKCRQIEDARKHTAPLPQTGEDGVEGPEVKIAVPAVATESTEASAQKAEEAAVKAKISAAPGAEAPKTEVPIETTPAEPAQTAGVAVAAQTSQADQAGAAAKPDDVAAPIASAQTPATVLEKALTLAKPAPRPEAKPNKAAESPTEKPVEKPAAKAAPKADDKPKAQAKPAPASAPAKNKGKNKGKKTK